MKRRGASLRFCGKSFRVFERQRLEGVKWRDGCFAQDAVGDWWLCLPVEFTAEQIAAPQESVGIDLGLKEIAVTSDGERLKAGRSTHGCREDRDGSSAADTADKPSACTGKRPAEARRLPQVFQEDC